jgi:hypothetical protein
MESQMIRPHAVSLLAMSKEALGQSLDYAWDEIERLRAINEKLDAAFAAEATACARLRTELKAMKEAGEIVAARTP